MQDVTDIEKSNIANTIDIISESDTNIQASKKENQDIQNIKILCTKNNENAEKKEITSCNTILQNFSEERAAYCIEIQTKLLSSLEEQYLRQGLNLLKSALENCILLIEKKVKALPENDTIKKALEIALDEDNLEGDGLKSLKNRIEQIIESKQPVKSENFKKICEEFRKVFEIHLENPLRNYVNERKFLKTVQDWFHDAWKKIFGKEDVALSKKGTLTNVSNIFFKVKKEIPIIAEINSNNPKLK